MGRFSVSTVTLHMSRKSIVHYIAIKLKSIVKICTANIISEWLFIHFQLILGLNIPH